MANNDVVYSTQLTELQATPLRKIRASHSEIGIYEAATITGRNTIHMVRVPAGTVIVGGQLRWDALTGSFTVGDQYDTDRFMTTTAFTVASDSLGVGTVDGGRACTRFNVVGDLTTHGVGTPYEYTCEQDILITTTDNFSATGTIVLILETRKAASA